VVDLSDTVEEFFGDDLARQSPVNQVSRHLKGLDFDTVVGQRVPEHGRKPEHSAECHQYHQQLQTDAQAIAEPLALGGRNRQMPLLVKVLDLELDEGALFRQILSGGTAEFGIVTRSLKGERHRHRVGIAGRCGAFGGVRFTTKNAFKSADFHQVTTSLIDCDIFTNVAGVGNLRAAPYRTSHLFSVRFEFRASTVAKWPGVAC
jgi:hypothetical protein